MTRPIAPFSRPVAVADVPPGGRTVEIDASAEERAALAADFDIVAINRLTARFEVRPYRRGGLLIVGSVEGEVTQSCVVTLDPVDQTISESVHRRFVPEEVMPAPVEVEIGVDEEDPPEPIEGGRVDLGVVAAEHLALGLDPYPKKPGVVYEGGVEGVEEDESPFAALARLKPDRLT